MEKIKSPGTVRRLSMKMRKLPELRRKLSLRSSRNQRHLQGQGGGSEAPGGADEASPPNARKESSNNVISRYHLDTSAPARPRRRSSRVRSATKGGYLSDGDSPELLPKQDLIQGSQGSGQDTQESPQPPPHRGWQDAVGSFRHYSLAEQPKCAQRVSGLLTVHLLGVSELVRSRTAKDIFCAIQVDGVTRARTALLNCQESSLPLNHTFNLELERARMLKLIVLTPSANNVDRATGPGGQTRNRVCCLGTVAIPPLFKGERFVSTYFILSHIFIHLFAYLIGYYCLMAFLLSTVRVIRVKASAFSVQHGKLVFSTMFTSEASLRHSLALRLHHIICGRQLDVIYT